MADEQIARMREFMGKLVTEALGWQDVKSVTVTITESYRLEDNGWDGQAKLHLVGGRTYAMGITSYKLDYAPDTSLLIQEIHSQFEKDMNAG